MKKWMWWVAAAILVVGGAIVGQRWLSGRAGLRAAMGELNLAYAQVERRDLEIKVSGNGTVSAKEKKSVQSGVAGKVGRILVEEGDLVAAGTPLLALANDSVTYGAEQALLDLALAEQALANLTGPAGSRAKSEMELSQAELDLSTAEERVSALSVKSPIDGEVWTWHVEIGDQVKANQTLLATVGDSDSFTVACKVGQADITKFRLGVAVSIIPGGDFPVLSGVVTSVGFEGTQGGKGTVEFPVTVTIENPHPDLRPGMSVTVNYTADDGVTFSLPSTISARERREVRAEVDGDVIRLLTDEGDRVRQGEVILALSNRALQVAQERAVLALETARQNSASTENAVEQQRLKVEQARVMASDKADLLGKLTVSSPIDGKVLGLSCQPGDEVSVGQSLLTIAQVVPLTIVIPVDELDIDNVAVGQTAVVEIDALPGEEFYGTVGKIAQEGAVLQGVTNFNVTVEILSDTPRLGMSARATIATSRKEDVPTIPVEAVRWDGGQAYVNLLEDGHVVPRKIKIGVQSDLYAEVVSGLGDGETVVIGNVPAQGFGVGGFRMPDHVIRVR